MGNANYHQVEFGTRVLVGALHDETKLHQQYLALLGSCACTAHPMPFCAFNDQVHML